MAWLPIDEAGITIAFGGGGNATLSSGIISYAGGGDSNFGLWGIDVGTFGEGLFSEIAFRLTIMSYTSVGTGSKVAQVQWYDAAADEHHQNNSSGTPTTAFTPTVIEGMVGEGQPIYFWPNRDTDYSDYYDETFSMLLEVDFEGGGCFWDDATKVGNLAEVGCP